jgi:hypothetical protein
MIEIIADPALGKDEQGNHLTLDVSLVQSQNLLEESKVAIEIVINDGQPAYENSEEVPNTQLYFMLGLDDTANLIDQLVTVRDQAMIERTAMLEQALNFRGAQLACAKGQIGALEIVKIADSDRGAVGFGFYDLIYTDDSGDDSVIAHVENIECYVPFIEEEQYEWLRTLVGGVHQYTSSIKIKLTGLNLEEVRESVINGITSSLRAQQDA